MKNRLLRLVKNDSGATAIEYGLIAAVMAVVVVTAMAFLSGPLENAFEYIGSQLGTPGGDG